MGAARVILGDLDGVADLERAIEIAAAASSHEEVAAVANLHSMMLMVGDLGRARELHVQAQEVAERHGLIGFISWQRGEHVVHCYWDGRWDEALATAADFIREVEAGSSHYMEGACRLTRTSIWLARSHAEAVAEARRATELARMIGDPQVLNPSLALEGRACLTAGDERGARALADELRELWRSVRPLQPTECVEAAWLFRGLGREEELLRELAKAPRPTSWQEAARLCASGDLVAAAETYARIGTVPDEAYSRLKAAEAFVAVGDRAAADAQLGLALPVFARLRASAWAVEAEALLAESA